MKLRMDDKQHLRPEIIKLPEYVCYQKEFKGTTWNEKYVSRLVVPIEDLNEDEIDKLSRSGLIKNR